MTQTDSLLVKYRPMNFDEIVGHEDVIDSVVAALDREQRVFLFSGVPGLGKTTFARVAAAELKIPEQNIIEMDGGKVSGVDAMRELTDFVSSPPLGGDPRMIILNECQGLSAQAWNSLLVNLEEPAAFNYWCLTTTLVSKVPAAAKQRCAMFQLKPVRGDLILALLDEIVEAEKIVLPKGVVDLCERECGGSPRLGIANLIACLGVKSLESAESLLAAASSQAEAFQLAQVLVQQKPWAQVRDLILKMPEARPESIRHVILNYVAKVAMGSKDYPSDALTIVACFIEPMDDGLGQAPLLHAVSRLFSARARAKADLEVPF